jgi:hypothetical protein
MADKYINGVKVTVCPPGPVRSELMFTYHGLNMTLGGPRLLDKDPNPPDSRWRSDREITLEDVLGQSAMSLREIMTSDEGEG